MHKKLAPAGELPTEALLGEKETGTSCGTTGQGKIWRDPVCQFDGSSAVSPQKAEDTCSAVLAVWALYAFPQRENEPSPHGKAGSNACFFPPRPLDWTGGDLFMRIWLSPSSHRKVSCTYRPVSGDVLAKPKLVKESASFPADTGHLFRPRVCNANS